MKLLILFFLLFVMLFFPSLIYGQEIQTFCMEGLLLNQSDEIVDFATIAVLSEVDSSYIAGSVSQENGKFKIENIPAGKYILFAAHLLYKRKYIDINVQESMILEPIVMETNETQLGEITITANFIQHEVDRYVISLQNNPITKGNNTKEVLALMPGVTSEMGALKINGQDVSQIYIDGRKLRDRSELEAIQAENIDKVEIVYMIGSEDDASNMGGAIYIKLKKMVTGGYYGSTSGNFSASIEEGHFSDNVNTSLNYRYKNLSVYNYISYGDFKNFGDYGLYSHYKDIDQYIDMETYGKGWTHTFSDRLSLTYEIDEKHNIGGNFRIRIANGSPRDHSQSIVKNNAGEQINKSNSIIDQKLRNRQYQAALNYNWLIDEKGSNFKLVADYLRYDNYLNRNNNYLYKLDTESPYEEKSQDRLDEMTDMVEVDARLALKVTEKSQFDVGVNYSLNKSDQLLNYQYFENNQWKPDVNLNDNYKLKGENYAGFISFSSSLGEKFTYKAGIRLQENNISYNSLKMNVKHTKSYHGFYPSLNLMYNIDNKGSLVNLSYQKSMYAIPYNVITPTVIYTSEYAYTKGNLDIKPENYHYFSLGGRINNEWNINYMFQYGEDILFFDTFQDEKDPLVSYTMPVNDGRTYKHSFSMDKTFKIVKWWNLRAFGRLLWDKNEGEHFHSSSWRPFVMFTNNINFDNGWGGNLSGFLEPTFKSRDRTYKTVHSVFGKIYKYLLNNKLLLNVDFTVYSHNRRLITETPDIWKKSHYKTNQTGFTIGVTYNFNGGNKVTAKRSESIQQYYELKDY